MTPATPLDDSEGHLRSNTHPTDWRNPPVEDRYNLVVLGAGTAGLVCAAGAAALGARVALIEKYRLGGDCLHHGCVPSKALLRCARAAAEVQRAGEFGVRLPGSATVDFGAVMARMRRLRAGLSHHDSVERFQRLGVAVFLGEARFTGADTVAVGGQTLRFARAVIATGARPAEPDVPGVDRGSYLTSESVFNLTELPRRLVVLGGGPVGCELAQAFRRFGSEVQLVQRSEQLLPKDEPAAAEILRRRFVDEGIQLHLGTRLTDWSCAGSEWTITLEKPGRAERLTAEAVLVAVGRRANVDNLGLEAAGVAFNPAGVQVNDFLQTSNPHIYAAGDVCSAYRFTHAADAMARLVLRNALFFGRARVSRLVIPWCTYTDPEVAHVGLTAQQADEQGLAIQTFRKDLAEVDRAVLDGDTDGFALIHVRKGSDRIVGATVVAAHAGEMVGMIVLAMSHGHGLGTLARTIQPYPTQAEVFRHLGDAHQRTRLTSWIGGLLRGILRWRR